MAESKVDYSVLSLESDPFGAELFMRGQRVSADDRSEMRAALRAGELDEVVFSAVVYRDGPNSNHTRFRAGDLQKFASSFSGKPFLRNHDVADIGSRDGVILSSTLVGGEFRQEIRLTTERGMRSFLEGVIDRFSIGWYFEDVDCSICESSWFECGHWPGQKYDGARCELVFVGPRGKETSAVNAPAVEGTRLLDQLARLKRSAMGAEQFNKERGMSKDENVILLPNGSSKVVAALADALPAAPAVESAPTASVAREVVSSGLDEIRTIRAQIEADRVEQLIVDSRLREEGKAVVRLAAKGQTPEFAAQLIEAQRKADGAKFEAGLVRGIRPVVTESMMNTPLDRVQGAWNWLLGDTSEVAPPPSLRNVRDLYLAVTGDFDWYGRFNPEWSQLAAATTTTLAGMTVNALNKVTRLHYDNMATYRWYENIVAVDPHDGSTQAVQLIMMDGIANLPIVSEGAAYTEATVGDSKEVMNFTKRGHYVGITLESIRRSDVVRLQAVPRLLVQGAIRSRSAAIASIFTVNTATGPVLADDSTALFHTNHGNTATTAFDAPGVAWAAARNRIFRQAIPGTAKPLGLWPKWGLFPMDLYDQALTLFGYGSGDVGKPGPSFGQTVNPYGDSRAADPRPIPVVVPDWTDVTNWAYIVDPRLHPVIHMAYANQPQGGAHALPEIFEVTDASSGLMFSNDTMPVKIRDWWSYGVSTYVGVGNNIVAG
jgi:hypothetical protein